MARHDENIVQPQLFSTTSSAQSELEIISRLPAGEELSEELQHIPNYQPDRAIREAVLARQDEWQEDDTSLIYTASNQLLVYLGTKQKPLPVEEALKTIAQFSTSTVLT